MAESASTSISVAQLTATTYEYSISLTDTGTTQIGTFWFSWIPLAGFLPESPSFSSPIGWSAAITDGVPPANGYSIQWVASNPLMPGQTLDGFTFNSTITPDVLFGASTIHPPTPVTTSTIYSGGPFSDAGFIFAAQPTPSVVSIAATDAVKGAGDSGTTPFTFTVSLDHTPVGTQTVDWSVAGSGAFPVDATDFGGTLPAGTLTFAPSETSKTITVQVVGDTTPEPDESFTVTLGNPSSGLTIGTRSADGTILHHDATGTVTAHNDAYILTQDHELTANAADSVLFNDDDATMATLTTGPSHGGLQLAADGSFSYTPDAGFTGIDGFSYHASNDSSSGDAEVLLFVVPTQGTGTPTLNLLALDAGEQVAATYTAFFSRGADAAGFKFWVGLFNQYLPSLGPQPLFANIASSFGVSDEAKALYPFLANPNGASDAQISSFLDTVYNNLFNRSSDPAGLAYWTGQIKQTLASGGFVGDVLVNIISGTQVGPDVQAMMGKVAVSLDYVVQQVQHNIQYNGATDQAPATALLHAVTSDPQTVLIGIKQADALIATHA
jgi:hypothetical protein